MNERSTYLIPANSKKSGLILGLFTMVDAILFGSGVLLTVVLLMAVKTQSLAIMLLILTPVLTTGLLVLPIPNYHNVLQVIINIYTFYRSRQRVYKWRGWCYKDGNIK